MLSSVLRSRRAVLVNVEIMRAFVRLRRILASNAARHFAAEPFTVRETRRQAANEAANEPAK